ncbi:hypothetical protein CR513_12126, partial [Mucuna pruriens]
MNSSGYEQEQQHDYAPSQTQTQTQTPSYDQSSQPYYAYNYAHDNQQDPTSLPIVPELLRSAEPSHTLALNPVQAAPVAGLNPAAVAVVAGALAQLVGNVDRVPREPLKQLGLCSMSLPTKLSPNLCSATIGFLKIAMMTGPSQYRGRGRGGGRPFRGSGRGRFNHHRGRGRGRGGDGREFSSHSSEPTIANVADVPAADGATSVMQPSSVSGQSSLPNPAEVPSAPLQAPPCKLWCEICKAECNTPEMLEQHKNGKRHRKNLLVHEEVQRLKVLSEQQSGNISTSQSNLTIQPEKVQESENKGLPEENMGSEATANNHNDETELQNNVAGVSKVQTEEPQEEPRYNFAIQGHGFKRKMRGGRGGKYMRSDDGSRKPVEPSKPKQVTSFICELCNVKCDSQVVYNSHLTGKKHLSNFKRVHGHQALNGEAWIQPLHPPKINPLSNVNNFTVQGVNVPHHINDPRNLLAQLLMTVLSNVQIPAPPATQIHAPALMAGSSHEPLSQNLSQTQVSDSLAHFETENSTGKTKDQMSSVTLQLEETAGSSDNGNTETADGGPAKEETAMKLPHNSSTMTPSENPVAENKQVPS